MDRTPKDPNDPYPEPIHSTIRPRRTNGFDVVMLAREYLADNAAESGADELISDLVDEVEVLRDALRAAEAADQKAVNCEEHEPSDAPETCEHCFPFADDARLKRWAALGINEPPEELAAKTSLPPAED